MKLVSVIAGATVAQVAPDCVKCSEANVLFFAGKAESGNFYDPQGYERFRDFILNEYEFGSFSENLVAINGDFAFDPDSEVADIRSIVNNEFAELNAQEGSNSDLNFLMCQAELCEHVFEYIRASPFTPITGLVTMGWAPTSERWASTSIPIFSLLGEYDGVNTFTRFVPKLFLEELPRNHYLDLIAFGNFRKWANAIEPFPFIGDEDLETKYRPYQIFRRISINLGHFIDNDRLNMALTTDSALESLRASQTFLEMDNEEGTPLAIDIQKNISSYEIVHNYVDDIDKVVAYVSDNTAYIFTELVEDKIMYGDDDSFRFSNFQIPFEHGIQVIDTSGQVTCAQLQENLLNDVLDSLAPQQMQFYKMNSCELISREADDFGNARCQMYPKNGVANVAPVESREGDVLGCKLLAPSRIYQWLMFDSHRPENLKKCHEFVGKPPCSTCPEE